MSLDVNLRLAIFWIAALLCLLAEAAILRSMLRGTRAGAPLSEAGGENAVPRGRPAVELIWAIVPAVALVFILLLTWSAIR